MPPAPRFQTLKPWLAARYGRPAYRVALDAGSTCPNRDGSLGRGGCVYCDVEGSGTGALRTGSELAAQLEAGIARVRRREPDCGIIAYFQSYSNTYVETERLREVLAVVEPHLGGDVCAVSVATRPDTLPPEALDVLAELGERTDVWLELGLESADDALLEKIRRHHGVGDFEDAVRRAHAAGLLVIGHAILGLAGFDREDGRRTARVLAECGVAGVKVHNLMVLARTPLALGWRKGEVAVLDHLQYVELLADFVERLGEEQVLHRITGDAPEADRLAPHWGVHKNAIRDLLTKELERRETRQGSHSLR